MKLASLPTHTLNQLQRTDKFWQNYQKSNQPRRNVVSESRDTLGSADCDVIICGGTLGILIGCALAIKGWRIILIEKGILCGREQEWNISRKELDVLLELELLTVKELEVAIATEYNPGRVAFHGGAEVWVRDVLNIGIDPVYLLEVLKSRFLSCGGKIFEKTEFEQVVIHPNGVSVVTKLATYTARLVLDTMGYFSPIVQQVRQNQKPDGVCMVVGSCAKGLPALESGDLLVTFTPIQNQCQYFWEAFPARDGRTTYLFTYVDIQSPPSFTKLFEDYLSLLPQYQKVDLAEINFVRTLFGFFPAYKRSPLPTSFNRILQIGDSSGSQSPLSFGGFGSMIRHLARLSSGIDQALSANLLSYQDLRLLQPYQPNLSVTWLFQKAMSVRANYQSIESDRINKLLSVVFTVMEKLGNPVLKPFLQDVVQFPALSQTMLQIALKDPLLVAKVIPQVGLASLMDWSTHYINLGAYSSLYPLFKALQPNFKNLLPEQKYFCDRLLDMYKFGSGKDTVC